MGGQFDRKERQMLPRISIVTPNFNTVRYIEDTMLSVLQQDYADMEYIVVDGGSTDGSLDVIRAYANRLAWWVSEPDQGMYDAINKGFSQSTGEIMGWLNSDDLYTPWAFAVVGAIFRDFPQVDWITSANPLVWNKEGLCIGCNLRGGFSRHRILRGGYLYGAGWCDEDPIQQESTFWRRSLWELAGGRLDATLKAAGDFELWLRFAKHAELYAVHAPLGGFRYRCGQKTSVMETYISEARVAMDRNGCRPYSRVSLATQRLANRYLPIWLQARLGFIEPCHLIRHQRRGEGGWHIVKSRALTMNFGLIPPL